MKKGAKSGGAKKVYAALKKAVAKHKELSGDLSLPGDLRAGHAFAAAALKNFYEDVSGKEFKEAS